METKALERSRVELVVGKNTFQVGGNLSPEEVAIEADGLSRENGLGFVGLVRKIAKLNGFDRKTIDRILTDCKDQKNMAGRAYFDETINRGGIVDTIKPSKGGGTIMFRLKMPAQAKERKTRADLEREVAELKARLAQS